MMEAQKKCLAFCRKTQKEEDTLLVVCNFSKKEYNKYQVGVPFEGKYKEIFNSDAEKFGGSGKGNPRAKSSKKVECCGREQSITIQLPPLGVCIFSCTPEKVTKTKAAKPERTVKPAKTKKPAAAKKVGAEGGKKA